MMNMQKKDLDKLYMNCTFLLHILLFYVISSIKCFLIEKKNLDSKNYYFSINICVNEISCFSFYSVS